MVRNRAAVLAVDPASSNGSTPMWKSVLDEAREVVWLASLVGGLSAVCVAVAIAIVAALPSQQRMRGRCLG